MAVTDGTLKTTIKRLFSEDRPNDSTGSDLLSISGDPIQLDNVIVEVLPDAVAYCSKASPHGGVNPCVVDVKAADGFPVEQPVQADLGEDDNDNVNDNDSDNDSVSPLSAPPIASEGEGEGEGEGDEAQAQPSCAYIDIKGVVAPPSDYVCMNWLQLIMPEWKRAAYFVADPLSALAQAQYNTYTASKNDNPVVVQHVGGQGKSLTAFPHRSEPLPVGTEANVKMGDLCYEKKYDGANLATDNEDYVMAVCHMAVSMLYEVFERGDAADRHKTLALELLGVTK